MSRTQRKGGNTSPIKHYLQFSGSTGTFSYYDKAAKERVELDELEIIVLDVRSSVTGFDATSKAQITSNMVAETGTEVMKVVSWKDGKSRDIAEGIYKDIKDKVTSKSVGGKFTANVICLCDVTGEGQEVCNLQLTGSALNGWIKLLETEKGVEYDNVITLRRGALSVVDGKDFRAVTEKEEKELDAKLKKNPRAPRPIWFYVIEFETVELSEDEADLATEQDSALQAYFEGVTSTKTKASDRTEDDEDAEEEKEQSAPDDAESDDKEKLPF